MIHDKYKYHRVVNETKDEIMKKHRKFLILSNKEDMIKKFQQMKINIQIL